MMQIWQAIILAIVEGVTEFLPISSTAHLVLVSEWLKISQTEFVKSFEIVIQLGAIMAIVWLFIKRVWERKQIWSRILIAFLPTAVIGFLIYKLVKTYLIGNSWVAVISLLIGGALIVLVKEKQGVKKIEDLTAMESVKIGLWQSLAMVPGVSRALATIWGGMQVGLSREAAVEMSFLLAVPTMAAATGLDLLKSGWGFSRSEWGILGLGVLVAFGVAIVAVKWLINYVKEHSFKGFGVYRILIAVIWGIWLIKSGL